MAVTEVDQVADFTDESLQGRRRSARFGQIVSLILNSLIMNGFIIRTNSPYPFTLDGGLASLSVTDGVTTVLNVNDLLFTSGATVSAGGSAGQADIAITGGSGGGFEHPFTMPTVASLTFVNDTGFTHTDDTNGVFLWNPSLTASDNLCLAHRAVPVGAWDNIIRIESLWADSGFPTGGAHLYESGTGKVITWGNQGTTSGQRLCANYFNSVTSFNSQPKTVPCGQRVTWLKISYDGTANFSFWWGMDGYSWVQFGTSVSKTAFFTSGATHAGFFLDPNDAAIIVGVKCLSYTLM